MHKPQQQVAEFARAMGVYRSAKPAIIPDENQNALRCGLITEELAELITATGAGDLVASADAVGDLLYVVYGMADAMGLDMEPIFDEIHASNMRKLGLDGKPIVRADGKILKPVGWTPPNLGPIIERQRLRADLEAECTQ